MAGLSETEGPANATDCTAMTVSHDIVFKTFLHVVQTARDFLSRHLPDRLLKLCDQEVVMSGAKQLEERGEQRGEQRGELRGRKEERLAIVC